MNLQASTRDTRLYSIHRALKQNVKAMTLPRYFGAAEDVLQTLVALVARGEGDLSISAASAGLAITPKDIVKQLQSAGLIYESIVLDVRRHFGVKYVMEQRSSEDIARLLDYQNAREFDNAFSGWMGVRPQEFQNYFDETDSLPE